MKKSMIKILQRALPVAALFTVTLAHAEDPAWERFAPQGVFAGDYATGDWFGQRDGLEERGIEFFGSYTADVWGNVSGGEKRGAVYTGLLELGVTLNLESLVGWQGASIHNSWLWLSGKDPSETLLGDDFFGVSNIAGFNTFRMFELWFQQSFLDDAVSIRLGQLAADEEFATSEYAGLFLNGTFGFPLALTESFPHGGPQYPLATPGIRLELNPTEWFTFRTAAFQGDPFAEDVNRHGLWKTLARCCQRLARRWRFESRLQHGAGGYLPNSGERLVWDPTRSAIHHPPGRNE